MTNNLHKYSHQAYLVLVVVILYSVFLEVHHLSQIQVVEHQQLSITKMVLVEVMDL